MEPAFYKPFYKHYGFYGLIAAAIGWILLGFDAQINSELVGISEGFDLIGLAVLSVLFCAIGFKKDPGHRIMAIIGSLALLPLLLLLWLSYSYT